MEESTPIEETKSGMPKTMIVVALVVVLILAGGVYEFNRSKSVNTAEQSVISESTQPATAAATPTSPAMQKQASNYKDGVYDIDGQYLSPGGEEQLGVSLTLKDGVIIDATVTPRATRPNSVKFQGIFSANYKPLVVGKNIDEVNLDVVSGSSLSPKGFNDAVTKIKEQAKA